jgi:peptidoglycan hydrolase FlgJ
MMSVDLVLGVIQAADASKLQPMRKKLAESADGIQGVFDKVFTSSTRAAEKSAATENGVDLIAGVVAAAKSEAKHSVDRLLASLDGPVSADATSIQQQQAARQLEESLLTTVVEQMIPKHSPSLYGEDAAADMARQFQVEQVAAAAAEAAPLGLAESLYGKRDGGAALKSLQWPYFVRSSITPYAA